MSEDAYFQECMFVVDETPYCLWDENPLKRNLEFLNTVDAGYFQHVASIHVEQLNGDDKQYVATALRVAYSHGLETLFALLCATVQAPACPVGWLLRYQNRELYSLVRKIHTQQPILSRLNVDVVTWDTIANSILYHQSDNPEQDKLVKTAFSKLWSRFATEFLDEIFDKEYNSIKHGFRLGQGGFKIALSMGETKEEALLQDIHSLEGSEYGSSFYLVRKLNETHNFYISRQSRNWNPQKFIHGLNLISISITNIVTFLKIVCGMNPSEGEFLVPVEDAYFDEPWKHNVDVLNFNIDSGIHGEEFPIITKEAIRAAYNKK